MAVTVRVRLEVPFCLILMEVHFILPFIAFLASAFFAIIINKRPVLVASFIGSSIFSLVYFGWIFYSLFSSSPSLELFYNFGGFGREIGVEYVLNSFNITILIAIASIFVIFSLFFANFVLKSEKNIQFNLIFCIIQVFCAACFAVLMTNDLFNFYIFFELLAICSYIFVSLGGKESAFASLNYLIMGVIASGFIVLGIGILYFLTGFLNIKLVSEALKLGVNFDLVVPFALILIGFFIKLAIFPFSFWPSLVYKNMPSAIMPLYAGTLTLVTLYCFNLFFAKFFLHLPNISIIKNIVLISVCLGVLIFGFFSILEDDIRKIFAYSTIAQTSYAMFSIFLLETNGVAAGFIHIFLNSLVKCGLFLILFEVARQAGSYHYSVFSNVVSSSKTITAIMFFLMATLIGLPFTPGFFTKITMILVSFNNNNYYFVAIIIFGALLNFLYFWKIVAKMLFESKALEIKLIKFHYSSKFSIIVIFLMLILIMLSFKPILDFEIDALKIFYSDL